MSRKKISTPCSSCGASKSIYLSDFKRVVRERGRYKCISCASKKFNIEVGRQFGKWTVVSEEAKRNGVRRFNCRCSCGQEDIVWATGLFSGASKGCRGCSGTKKYVIEVGQKYSQWEIIKEIPKVGKHRKVLCKCDCGFEGAVFMTSLRSGKSKRCPGCAGVVKQEISLNQRFGSWVIIKELEVPSDNRKFTCKCDCGAVREVFLTNLTSSASLQCKSCVKTQKSSKGEKELGEWISKVWKGEVLSNDWDTLKNQELDILLPNLKLAIEYNGLYWHSELKKDKYSHFKKRKLCESKGIRLVQINSDEWIGKKPIVKSIIKHILGLNTSSYFARKLDIKEPTQKEAQDFLDGNHLMGTYKVGRIIGLYEREKLVQLLSYQLQKDQTKLDLARVCSLQDCSVKGGVSRLLKWALRRHPSVKQVTSFVDLRYANGKSLIKMGFKSEDTTLGWKWTDLTRTYNRLQCRANMDSRKLTQAQHAEELKWYKLYDAGQAKFVLEVS